MAISLVDSSWQYTELWTRPFTVVVDYKKVRSHYIFLAALHSVIAASVCGLTESDGKEVGHFKGINNCGWKLPATSQ